MSLVTKWDSLLIYDLFYVQLNMLQDYIDSCLSLLLHLNIASVFD